MKKRLLYILAGIGILLALVALVGFFNKRKGLGVAGSPSSPALPGVLPENLGPGLSRAPSGDTIALGTSRGSVQVKNFYKNVVDSEEGSLILRGTASYTIGYNTLNSTFKIVIFAGPLGTIRAQAEDDFLGLLGVSKSDGCRLTVKIVVYAGVDKNAAEKGYPLSFCAGAPVPQ